MFCPDCSHQKKPRLFWFRLHLGRFSCETCNRRCRAERSVALTGATLLLSVIPAVVIMRLQSVVAFIIGCMLMAFVDAWMEARFRRIHLVEHR